MAIAITADQASDLGSCIREIEEARVLLEQAKTRYIRAQDSVNYQLALIQKEPKK